MKGIILAGIRDILIISTPDDIDKFEQLLGSGEDLGLQLSYAVQPSPDGIAHAFIIGESFISKDRVALILGDNIFFGRGFAWLDTGTHEALLEASHFIETIEKKQGFKIACIEEVAFNMGHIEREQLLKLAQPLEKNGYGEYLQRLAEEDKKVHLN